MSDRERKRGDWLHDPCATWLAMSTVAVMISFAPVLWAPPLLLGPLMTAPGKGKLPPPVH